MNYKKHYDRLVAAGLETDEANRVALVMADTDRAKCVHRFEQSGLTAYQASLAMNRIEMAQELGSLDRIKQVLESEKLLPVGDGLACLEEIIDGWRNPADEYRERNLKELQDAGVSEDHARIVFRTVERHGRLEGNFDKVISYLERSMPITDTILRYVDKKAKAHAVIMDVRRAENEHVQRLHGTYKAVGRNIRSCPDTVAQLQMKIAQLRILVRIAFMHGKRSKEPTLKEAWNASEIKRRLDE